MGKLTVNQPPIIVEGPDGSGKTTLAKQLADAFNRDYTRPPAEILDSAKGPQGGDVLVEWWNSQLALTPKELSHLVYDRCFYISDPIYQQAQIERDLLCHGADLAQGIMKLWNVEPVFVFCLPDFEYQISNVRASGRDRLEGVGDKSLEKVSNAYWAFYGMWSNSLYDRVILYDYTVEGSWDRLGERLHDSGVK